MEDSIVSWNIFARELDDILRAHGSWIGQLDNNRMSLHPQQVARLQKSLANPKPLVLLNPEDLDRIVKVYKLTESEQHRLKAAVLATAVERVLMDRIDASTALMAANDVFHILHAMLDANPDLAHRLKDGALVAPALPEAEVTSLAAALEILDQATFDLNLAVQTPEEVRQQQAFLALQSFTAALEALERCSPAEQETETWQFWYGEAKRGYAQAQRLMDGGTR